MNHYQSSLYSWAGRGFLHKNTETVKDYNCETNTMDKVEEAWCSTGAGRDNTRPGQWQLIISFKGSRNKKWVNQPSMPAMYIIQEQKK